MASNISPVHLHALVSAIHPSDTHLPGVQASGVLIWDLGISVLVITQSSKWRRAPRGG
jgi:hypothetical protein